MITKQFKIKGFTLIEMLTVIIIIGVLAGLLIPASSKARRDAAVRKAQTTVAALETALSMYYTDYGVYPLSATSGGTQQNGNAFVTISSGTNLVAALSATTKGGPYMKFRTEDLLRSGLRYVLKDPWGRAYIYVCRSGYTGTTRGPYHPNFTPLTANDLNRNTYNIYSLGSDGMTYGGAAQDITDWDNSTLYDDEEDGDSDNTQGDTDARNDDDINNW